MIHYHGTPITPKEASFRVLANGDAFISFRRPDDIALAAEVCQSIALDNGAFSAWRAGEPIKDWWPFYAWAYEAGRLPCCDFAVIPDVIDGTEEENDQLVNEWPLDKAFGAPVWHMHESLDRLDRLVSGWRRVCLGSSGEFASPGTPAWWARMSDAMGVACDAGGRPRTKLHGLRMLSTRIFTKLPLSSADSTNVAQNVGKDEKWEGGRYQPVGDGLKSIRGVILRSRIEAFNSPSIWRPTI